MLSHLEVMNGDHCTGYCIRHSFAYIGHLQVFDHLSSPVHQYFNAKLRICSSLAITLVVEPVCCKKRHKCPNLETDFGTSIALEALNN